MTAPETDNRPKDWDGVPPPPLTHSSLCPVFLALGWVCVGLGFIGAFLPGLPTTVFLIIALWAFSKSSDRLRWWLWTHPRFGATLRAWHMHRVIPPPAKAAAVVMMMISVAIIAVSSSSWQVPAILAAVLAPIAAWIVTRRSAAPVDSAVDSGEAVDA
ncbi:MAG: YbaN family protein [Rhodospirillaceae bacterium]|jgi:uncharacterized protein|nr:YbaN family protein [Rhodospirillaceae bacterium]MBT5565596.1 YbaN family protein [Rhodospirillaceae bacterium]MBT6088365.1 YbaN family protein [Rhodospirillaceae bacterium]MBT6959981.1 YbaN family protein [Rhodospirillaceae bacterium]MBT7451490.1 YbaN family protein [Rhodospirillaceae bacterium]